MCVIMCVIFFHLSASSICAMRQHWTEFFALLASSVLEMTAADWRLLIQDMVTSIETAAQAADAEAAGFVCNAYLKQLRTKLAQHQPNQVHREYYGGKTRAVQRDTSGTTLVRPIFARAKQMRQAGAIQPTISRRQILAPAPIYVHIWL